MEENVLLDASMAGIIMAMSPPADRGCMSVKSASVPARKDKGLTAVVIVERTIKFSTAIACQRAPCITRQVLALPGETH
jgi:hypothetical protein